jgi:pimeloyl-ACP methyl ester carboxylesterase
MIQLSEFEDDFDRSIQVSKFSSLPELIGENTGYAYNGKIKIFYEVTRPQGKKIGSILLISRNSETLISWPQNFLNPFLEKGYELIRFDNRDLGMSDWIENWTKKKAYSLEDMSRDAMAVVDKLRLNNIHLIGSSMGGMIAQRLVIDFPNVFKSLTCIMSSGYYFDPELISLSINIKKNFSRIFFKLAKKPITIEKILKIKLAIDQLWLGKGDYTLDLGELLKIYNYELKLRRGFNRDVFKHHSWAIKESGSRLYELKSVKCPSLIIHGTDDPLINLEHAKKYVKFIPKARKYYLEGMGHDLPDKYIKPITNEIINLISVPKN